MKVLIITPETICNKSSSGFILKNLFKGFSNKDIAQIYFSNSTIDFNLCTSYWVFPNRKFYFNSGNQVVNEYLPKLNRRNSILSKYFIQLEPIIDFFPLRISDLFYEWIDTFKPDIIYTWMGSKRSMDLSIRLSKDFDVPIVLHFMDNWLFASVNQYKLLRRLEKFNLRYAIKLIRENVSYGITISNEMMLEYKKYINIPMCYIPNGIDDSCIMENDSTDVISVDGNYVIGLFGRLEIGRYNIFKNFVYALGLIQSQKFTINLYTDSSIDNDISLTENVKINISPPPLDSEIRLISQNINCLLYIDDLYNLYNKEYFKFSFSGKIPLYLALAKPIITIGPISNYSVKYLSSINVGPVITTNEIDNIVASVREVLNYSSEKLKSLINNSKNKVKSFQLGLLQKQLLEIFLDNLKNK